LSGTRKSTFTNIRTKKNGNTGGERTGKNTDEQTHTSQKINDSSNSFSHPNSTPEPELNDEQTETPQEKFTNRLSEFNKLLPTGTNTNTDQELTWLMLQIESHIRFDLYYIVKFFDRLFSEDDDKQIDQEPYLSAIKSAGKSVKSMTDFINSKRHEINSSNIFVGIWQAWQAGYQLVTNYSQIQKDKSDFHSDMIAKLKKHPDIQNYLLSLARLKILDQQSSNQDRTEEEQKALDDYNNFVAKIKTITEIKEIWDNHQ
jgi:SepF-like predicted cell division protein (DUF552 family)